MGTEEYNVIVVGAGMGGLSAAAFLAREGKRVLVLEKHDKPGGYVTSFKRGRLTFDSAIFHLTEMRENQTILQFIRYWGNEVGTTKVRYMFRYFIGGQQYLIGGRHVEQDLIRYFPNEELAIRKFFSISGRMMDEMLTQGPPKPPYEMSLLEKIGFGFSSLWKRRLYLQYGAKHSVRVLRAIFRNRTLASILWGYYPIHSLVFFGHVYGWEMVKRDENYYPQGGLQAIPNAAVKALERNGGTLLLNTEVACILVKDRRAVGVRCGDGREYKADIVISNAPIHNTLFQLLEDEQGLEKLREEVKRRKVFVSAMFVYLTVDENYDFKGVNNFVFLENDTMDIKEENLTPQNCPIMLIIPPKPEGQTNYSAILAAVLPYEYKDCWQTYHTRVRGKEYRRFKEAVKQQLLDRVRAKLGNDFRSAIRSALAATPLTFERYTYNERGSLMGWKVDEAHYGRFIPQTTPIENLYLVGHWVFPGFGVPGVMASGYYLAKGILRKEGIDLTARFEHHTAKGRDDNERREASQTL